MTILLCDPRVAAVPVADNGDPLVRLDATLSPTRTLVRAGLAERLRTAHLALPPGIGLRVGPRPGPSHPSVVGMTILLSDPRVSAVPVHDCAEPLVRLDARPLPDPGSSVRAGLAERLYAAHLALPPGIGLRVVEGHRSADDQQSIITAYAAEVCAARPGVSGRRARRAHQPLRRTARGGAARGRRRRRPHPGRRLRRRARPRHPDRRDARAERRPLLLRRRRDRRRRARAPRACSPGCWATPASSTTRPSGGTGATATATGRCSPAPRRALRPGRGSRRRHERPAGPARTRPGSSQDRGCIVDLDASPPTPGSSPSVRRAR